MGPGKDGGAASKDRGGFYELGRWALRRDRARLPAQSSPSRARQKAHRTATEQRDDTQEGTERKHSTVTSEAAGCLEEGASELGGEGSGKPGWTPGSWAQPF